MKKLTIATFIASIIIPISLQAETKYEIAYGKCTNEAGMMNNSVMASCSEAVSTFAKKDITAFLRKYKIRLKFMMTHQKF